MNYYVKELADKSAILVAEDGFELEVFPSVRVAIAACCKECLVWPLWVEHYYSYLENAAAEDQTGYLYTHADFDDLVTVH